MMSGTDNACRTCMCTNVNMSHLNYYRYRILLLFAKFRFLSDDLVTYREVQVIYKLAMNL